MEPRVSHSPDLHQFNRSDVDEFREASPLLLHEVIRKEGADELDRPRSDVFWSGISAGLVIGLSALGFAAVESHLPDAEWTVLLSSLGFTLGFLVIILGRQGSIGETSLTGVLPVLTEKTKKSFSALASLWSVVLIANLIGVILIAALFALTDVLPIATRLEMTKEAHSVLAAAGWTTFFKAVLAGWIIALAVWTASAARTAKVAIVVLLTYATKLFGLHHLLAGSVSALTGVFVGTENMVGYLVGLFLPVLLGNLVGAVGLVAVLTHAQVSRELKNAESRKVDTTNLAAHEAYS